VVSLSEPSGSVSSDSLLPFVDSSGSGVGLFRALGVGVCFGFDADFFFELVFPFVDFDFELGVGFFLGVGEATARVSNESSFRLSAFFFSSSGD